MQQALTLRTAEWSAVSVQCLYVVDAHKTCYSVLAAHFFGLSEIQEMRGAP